MNHFQTQNMGLVAALRLHGFDPDRKDRDAAGKVTWTFTRTEALAQTANAYFNGSLMVSAHAFNRAMFVVKTSDVWTEYR